MSELRKAAEMALEALEHAVECVQTNYLPDKCGHDWDKQIEALRQALAQPEQEPVSYQDTMDKCRLEIVPAKGTLLNTTPPKREWVGLTDDEAWGCWNWEDFNETWKKMEAKLKEKNT